MKQTNKQVTVDLIRKYFGKRARVKERWGGGFRVITPSGGKVVIRQRKINIISGGDAAYRAATRLAQEIWGGAVASGSNEHIMACVAHGEAWGLDITADTTQSTSSGCVAVIALVFAFVFAGNAMGANTEGWALMNGILALLALGFWAVLRQAEKTAAKERAEAMGFNYPRVHGLPRGASHDDAEREGWV